MRRPSLPLRPDYGTGSGDWPENTLPITYELHCQYLLNGSLHDIAAGEACPRNAYNKTASPFVQGASVRSYSTALHRMPTQFSSFASRSSFSFMSNRQREPPPQPSTIGPPANVVRTPRMETLWDKHGLSVMGCLLEPQSIFPDEARNAVFTDRPVLFHPA